MLLLQFAFNLSSLNREKQQQSARYLTNLIVAKDLDLERRRVQNHGRRHFVSDVSP